MLLNDAMIRNLCTKKVYTEPRRLDAGELGSLSVPRQPVLSEAVLLNPEPMIEPFSEAVSGNGVISYGLSHAGYDLRLGPEIMLFKNSSMETIDPKRFMDENYRRRMFDEWTYSTKRIDDTLLDSHQWTLNSLNVTRMDSDNSYVIPPNSYILGRSLEYLRIPRHIKGRCVGKSTLARSGILVNTTPLEPGWCGHLTIEIGNITPCPAKVYVMEGIAQLEFELLTAPPEVDYEAKDGQYQGQLGVTPARVK